MGVDERIVKAVTAVVAVCEPEEYTPESGEGVAEEYCTYNYDLIPAGFGSNRPRTARALVQVHWYLPRGKRPNETRLALCRALRTAGFTYPTVTDAADGNGQHWVLECETLEAV